MSAFVEQRRVGSTAAAKTGQIMARFRPIAPKPMPPPPPPGARALSSTLQPCWPSGKRGTHGHGELVRTAPDKRQKGATPSSSYYPPSLWRAPAATAEQRQHKGFPSQYSLAWPRASAPSPEEEAAPASCRRRLVPVERDLLGKLQEPSGSHVVRPRPVRPLRTTICVDTSTVTGANSGKLAVCRMSPGQVEAELHADTLPAVVSGRGNRVLLANDAYKALVGQPVCPWLDAVPCTGASRRINGEVALDVRRFTAGAYETTTTTVDAAGTRGGAPAPFSCNSRITWERNGTLVSVASACDVMRLACGSGDYLFVWRFDTTKGSTFYCPM